MNQAQVQENAARLFAELWQHKYLPNDHAYVHAYVESQDVRNCLRRMTEQFGFKIVRTEKNMHIMAQPGKSFLTNPINELRKSVKSYETQTDLYLMGVIWMVIFSEADNELAGTIKWENDGFSYGEIEDLVTKTLNHWQELNESSEGIFAKEWSLAVTRMYAKWKVLSFNKMVKGRVSYTKDTRLGLIDCAARELEKDKMVFIEQTAQMSKVTPKPVFYERLKARFGNMDKFQDRYDLLKVLIEDVRESGEMGA
ncbi:hypothetical protein FIU87_03395 [Bacillus sp. THAF10]|uniref:DUF6063 family protein n=1 Tax=Bacillus sp. THAF10 TaxID=2587848 RepID=UPI0012685828|nr:DUF6063 family protein [Bacillus sp. THAF10]QFT87687.1 hypothetical protein FIU87_03395 [Bacillus sp. THAF10]